MISLKCGLPNVPSGASFDDHPAPCIVDRVRRAEPALGHLAPSRITAFVAFCWECLAQGTENTMLVSSVIRFAVGAAAMLPILAVSGISHVLWVLCACHKLSKQYGSESVGASESES